MYAAIVLVPIVLLQGMLLDYVRVKYTQFSMEKMTRAFSRSVLSAFDRQLRDYGLFGLQASEAERIHIISSLLEHYRGSESSSGLLPGRNVHKVQITPLYTLADHAVIQRQINEEMKLKAPLAFTAFALDMWNGKGDWLQDEQEKLKQAERIERLLHERGRALDGAYEAASELYAELQTYADSVTNANSLEHNIAQLHSMLNVLASKEEQLLQAALAYAPDGHLSETEAVFSLLLDEGYVQAVEQQSARLVSQYRGIAAAASGATEPEDLQQIQQAHAELMAEASNWLNRIHVDVQSRQTALARLDAVKDNSRRALVQSLAQAAREADKQICAADDGTEYAQLRELEQAYRSYNAAPPGYQAYPRAALTQTPEEYQRQALSIIGQIAKLVETIRDEVYVNEYTLYNFSHRLASKEDRIVPSGEVEYSLYGMTSCADNLGSAYADIFMLRFGIRMVETLTQARTAAVAAAGSPLALFLHAAAEGAVMAAADMERLLHGERIDVFGGVDGIRIGYEGYLRFLLAVHVRPVDVLPRLQALIELQTGTSLFDRPAHVEVQLQSAVGLWFLPAAAKLAQRAQHIDGPTWMIEKRAVMAY